MIKDEEDLEKLQQAYARVFEEKSPYVQIVLEDLSRFCRMEETCFHADPRIHAVAEGRREVGLRIKEFSRLPFQELKRKLVIRHENQRLIARSYKK